MLVKLMDNSVYSECSIIKSNAKFMAFDSWRVRFKLCNVLIFTHGGVDVKCCIDASHLDL